MYRLKVVAGPNRGTSFEIRQGENPIGRQTDNAIVLQSAKISKRHCVLVVNHANIELRDENSANGTFINGVLSKQKRLKVGDRIGIGEYLLELRSLARRKSFEGGALAPVIQFPTPPVSGSAYPSTAYASGAGASEIAGPPAAPEDLKSRLHGAFERYIMPLFYGLLVKHEWNVIIMAIFAVFTVVNVVICVSPLLDANRNSIVQETKRRGRYIARQVAEMNAPLLASHFESKTDLGIAPTAEGVRLVVLTDLESRVIAPATRVGQTLVAGPEARLAKRAVDLFRKGREFGIAEEVDESTVAIVEPVKIYSPAVARNVVVAMVIVAIDTSLATMSMGEMGEVYSKSLIFSSLLCLVVAYIAYRLTLRPFHQLGEDLDRVLKGDMSQVTREYKIEEMKDLWDLITVAVQRIPKDQGAGGGQSEGSGGPMAEDFIGPLRTLGPLAHLGIILFGPDRKIIYLNEMFEEMSGIRPGDAVGHEIGELARDQSVGQVFSELFERASSGNEGVSETAELSPGISFRIHMGAFGRTGETPRCYVVTAVKGE